MTTTVPTISLDLQELPTTMRAAIFIGGGKPLEIRDWPVPTPGPGEILVKVVACGLCHSDLHYLDHGVPTFKQPPLVLGHEVVGHVVRVGAGVDPQRIGTAVLLAPETTCGTCVLCRTGRENVCSDQKMLGNNIDGGFADYIVTTSRDAFPVPDGLPLVEMSVVSDALTTAFNAVVRRAQIQPGETVAVVGCGGLGLSLVQVTSMVGARVIAVDIDPKKLELALQFGASAAVDGKGDDAPKRIRKEAGGGGVEVAIEAIGRPETQETAIASLRTGGRAIFLGSSAKPMTLQGGRVMYRELSVIGTLGSRPIDFPVVMDLVKRGKLNAAALVTHRHTLDQVNEGFDELRKGIGIRHVAVIGAG
ncbi:MAG: zinc-binding dehydrogenase [Chloroflexota bacterium]|nr:zinc-binding dehydrogenase [Chloroflexota bacterium]MDE3194652.1 zinc-binding dehydrogenase [Chloroflexota bacterium]